MAPQIKSTKVGTRGNKQIVEENASTLNFYRNMVFGAVGAYLTVMMVFFEFTSLTRVLTLLSGIIYIACYQFMAYIAKPEYSDTNQLVKSGVDLNIEGGIAEHVKDLIILTAGCQVFSLMSNYVWLFWLLAPIRAFYFLWVKILSFRLFPEAKEHSEIDEKKQRKLERKMARRQHN